MKTDQYSLTHTLLAALPVREERDDELRRAVRARVPASGKTRRRAPVCAESADHNGWLLKLHGTRAPEDIVLTRGDYIAVPERDGRRSPASSRVCSITKHMLFIGFSLGDDNFHRIATTCRRALRGTSETRQHRPFGTAVVLEPEPPGARGALGGRAFASSVSEHGGRGPPTRRSTRDLPRQIARRSEPQQSPPALTSRTTRSSRSPRSAATTCWHSSNRLGPLTQVQFPLGRSWSGSPRELKAYPERIWVRAGPGATSRGPHDGGHPLPSGQSHPTGPRANVPLGQ